MSVNARRRRIREHHQRTAELRVRTMPVTVPPPCAADVYASGSLVFQTHSLGRPPAIERWVQSIAKASGQPVDWHFAAGRVCVLALGDLARVRAATRAAMPEHDAMYRAEAMQYAWMRASDVHPPRPAWWSDDAEPELFTAPRVVKGADGALVLVDPVAAAMVAAIGGAS